MNPSDRNPSEERIENGDDIRHAFDDLRKRLAQHFAGGWSWHKRMVERYKDGDLAVHLHVSGLLFGQRWDRCIVCEARPERGIERKAEKVAAGIGIDAGVDKVRFAGIVGEEQISLLAGQDAFPNRSADNEDLQRDSVRDRDCKQGPAVLVLVYEGVQEPQRLIPSVVRLQSLNCVQRGCGNAVVRQAYGSMRGPPILPQGEIGRMLPFAEGGRGVFQGELGGDVVEARPQASQTLTEDESQFMRGLRREDGRLDSQNIVLWVALGGEGVWGGIDISPDFSLQVSEVLIRALTYLGHYFQ